MTPIRALVRPFVVLAIVSAFVACGGGGSNSTAPGIVNLPPPAATPTASTPTTAPVGSGATSTPLPTLTPLPTSSPGSTAVPTATPMPVATPTPAIASAQMIETQPGSVAGTPNEFSPSEGDTAIGGQGSPVDGIPCQPTMSNNYHVHIYLGVFVNGSQVALPIAIGMANPGAPSAGFINSATCFYFLHTHDSSGIVHVEDTNPTGAPITASLFTLQNVLDVWGITADANHFGPFTGPVEVFTSGQVYRGNSNLGAVPSSTLSYYGPNPSTVPLYSHEIIYVEVGPTYPTSLPGVKFYMQF